MNQPCVTLVTAAARQAPVTWRTGARRERGLGTLGSGQLSSLVGWLMHAAGTQEESFNRLHGGCSPYMHRCRSHPNPFPGNRAVAVLRGSTPSASPSLQEAGYPSLHNRRRPAGRRLATTGSKGSRASAAASTLGSTALDRHIKAQGRAEHRGRPTHAVGSFARRSALLRKLMPPRQPVPGRWTKPARALPKRLAEVNVWWIEELRRSP